jgi:hypothetical protein
VCFRASYACVCACARICTHLRVGIGLGKAVGGVRDVADGDRDGIADGVRAVRQAEQIGVVARGVRQRLRAPVLRAPARPFVLEHGCVRACVLVFVCV